MRWNKRELSGARSGNAGASSARRPGARLPGPVRSAGAGADRNSARKTFPHLAGERASPDVFAPPFFRGFFYNQKLCSHLYYL